MLHFVLGRVNSGKTSYIINEIKCRRESGTLLVVPEQHSHSTERLLCEACGNTVSSYAEVTNFRRLATKVKSEHGGIAAETVDGGKRILLLYNAAKAVSPALKVLAKTAARPESLEELMTALDEFKAYGVSPEAVARVARDVSESLAKKLSDIAVIYSAYENALNEDEYDAYDELSYIAASLRTNDFFNDRTVYFDGYTGFSAAQFDIIEAALCKACDVYVALEIPENYEAGAENGIFDKAYETKKRLEALSERNGITFDKTYLTCDAKNSLQHLDESVFSDTACIYDGDSSEITVIRANNPFEECELCAAYILDRVRNGARFRDFSVAVTDGSTYFGVCESVFSRYGIPVYTSTVHEMTSKPVISLLLYAFECILHGFSPRNVMGYLKTGFSGVSAKSLDLFENYMYTWSPKAFLWNTGRDFTQNPLGLTAEETEESREILRVVNRVREKIYNPISRLVSVITKNSSGEKCAEALYEFINEINLPRRCMAYSYISELDGRMAEAQEYRAIMGVLCDAIDCIGRTVGDAAIDAEELFNLFKIVISQYELATIPAALDCVTVSDMSRADGEKCAVRIILGAEEGAFPKNGDGGGLLSDNDRAELSDFGIELAPGMSDRIFEEYRTVHSVLCSSHKALYISSSALGKNGEERSESPVVSRIREIFKNVQTGMDIKEARMRAKIPCFDECIASRQLQNFWENDIEYGEKLQTARFNAKGTRGPILKKENREAIFGSKIRLSASRADLFSSCRYAYFLKYGMRATIRERAEISPIEAGSLMHYVLEKVIFELSKDENYDIKKALELSESACREYVETTLKGTDRLSGRMEFLIKRLEKTVKAAVCDICEELQKSKFKPCEFELKFTGAEGDLPPLEIKGEDCTVLLRGAVDRVDTYKENGALYFRVIDYKSGKKEFSLDEAVNGIGMQMLLYMFALEEMGEMRYGEKPQPAGVMYVPVARELTSERGKERTVARREGVVLRDMQVINAMEEGEKKVYIPVSIDKNGGLKKSSVVLTASEFESVKKRMRSILSKIGDELYNGHIEPNPYIHKTHSSCDYCEYKSVCAFDEERTSDTKRELCDVKLCDVITQSGGGKNE